MPTLQQYVTDIVSAAFSAAGFDTSYGAVVFSERPDLSQFQCNGALKAAKQYGQSPRSIAEAVSVQLQQNTEILSNVQVDGPGFLNISLTDTAIAAQLNQYAQSEIVPQDQNPQTVIVDFGGPNVAKPLHVGHLRSSIIGDSIQKLHRALGHTVYGDIHLGDWGTPMGILIAFIQREQPELIYFDPTITDGYPAESPVSMADLERLYPAGSTLLKEDAEFQRAAQQATAELQAGRPGYRALWNHFITVSEVGLKDNFKSLGVEFDWWYGESHYHDRIDPLVEKLKSEGIAVESKGALIIPLPEQNGTEIPPLILLKSDGAFLYSTTDLACVDERVHDNHANQIIYVVDQRQHLHFTQVFSAARLAKLCPENVPLIHAGFGTINGSDGKPFKTRAGGVMRLRDLITMVTEKATERMVEAGMSQEYPEAEQKEIARKVGISALKFADLINNRTSNYIFDLDRFVSFEGKTGPYLVYTAVRIQSILRKLKVQPDTDFVMQAPTDVERGLMLTLSQLPDVVNATLEGLTPHTLAEYGFTLAQEFNRFYQQTSIIHEQDTQKQQGWLALSLFTLKQLTWITEILGMEIPERM